MDSAVITLHEYSNIIYDASGKKLTPEEKNSKAIEDMGKELYDLDGRISDEQKISEKDESETKQLFSALEGSIKSGDKAMFRQTLDKIDSFYRRENVRSEETDDILIRYTKLREKYLADTLGLKADGWIDSIISKISAPYTILSNLEYSALSPAEKEKEKKGQCWRS